MAAVVPKEAFAPTIVVPEGAFDKPAPKRIMRGPFYAIMRRIASKDKNMEGYLTLIINAEPLSKLQPGWAEGAKLALEQGKAPYKLWFRINEIKVGGTKFLPAQPTQFNFKNGNLFDLSKVVENETYPMEVLKQGNHIYIKLPETLAPALL